MECNHLPIALTIIGVAFLMFYAHNNDGFRTQEQKNTIASQLVAQKDVKPEFEPMKSLGLDGAEYYSLRQLWNKKKYTKGEIIKVL